MSRLKLSLHFILVTSLRTANIHVDFNPLSANPEKWSNTLKQIVGNLPTICLSVFDHFMNLALKGLKVSSVLQNMNIFCLGVILTL